MKYLCKCIDCGAPLQVSVFLSELDEPRICIVCAIEEESPYEARQLDLFTEISE